MTDEQFIEHLKEQFLSLKWEADREIKENLLCDLFCLIKVIELRSCNAK